MSDFNQITIVGKLGRDPDYKDGGQWQRCSFSIATSQTRKGVKKTTWFRVTAWGKTADICSRYLRKGHTALVCGEASLNEFVKQDGTKSASIEVNANSVKLLSQSTRAAAGDSGTPPDDDATTPAEQNPSSPAFDDSEIPF